MAAAVATQLTGRQRAAILLMSLGPELSARVLQSLPEDQVEVLAAELMRVGQVPAEVRDAVLRQAHELALGNQVVIYGDAYARELLVRALGRQKAEDLISRLEARSGGYPLEFLRKADPQQLLSFIQHEHPQTIALILCHLPARQASQLLSALEPELQADVAKRIATMGRTPPEVVQQVVGVLRRKLSLVTKDFSAVGGVDSLVRILTYVDRSTEKTVLEQLDQDVPEIANEIRKRRFVFDNIIQLDDRSLQRVLREVDTRDLALALRGAPEALREKVFRNLSSRAAEMLREEISMMGPVRLRQVEEAQQRIVAIIRRLDEAEEIVISRGGEDVLV